jgi:hypothetical protein
MNSGRTIFSQLMDFVPIHEFRRCVERYRGNHKIQTFSCWDQFLCMAFAQLTYRESLRDIEACLRLHRLKMYHMGIRSRVARNTLAHANEIRDWRIYVNFAHVLIAMARRLYAQEDIGVDLSQPLYALDSTVIDLCLSVFPWAKFRKRKAAIKLHTLLDIRAHIPAMIVISDGALHDSNILAVMEFEPGAFYMMDRGYLDFINLYRIHQAQAFFVTRAKRRFRFKRRQSHPVDKSAGVRSDQTIVLAGHYPHQWYPCNLRRIRYIDPEENKTYIFLTNNFDLPAQTIAKLYRLRWQIELFFKWIKQHLRIKAFYGTTENAVKTQIWIAISVYVLVAIVKKHLELDLSLYNILQVLSVSLFEKIPLLQAFSQVDDEMSDEAACEQLTLFD